MKPSESQTAPSPAIGDDAASVFSRFSAFSTAVNYQEVVRQEAAVDALGRWPLLAELHGLAGAEDGGDAPA